MYLKKYLFFVILFSFCLSLSAMTEDELYTTTNRIVLLCNASDAYCGYITNTVIRLNSLIQSSSASPNDKTACNTDFAGIVSYVKGIVNYNSQIRDTVTSLVYDSSIGGCNWSTNDVLTLLTDMASLVTDIRLLNDALFDDPGNIKMLVENISQNSSYLSTINGYLSNIEINSSIIRTNLTSMQSYLNNIKNTLNNVNSFVTDIDQYLWDMLPVYLDDITSYISSISSNSSLMIDILGVITYDVGNISTNTAYIVQQLNIFTNRFYYSNLMGYDRFRYFGKPMAGAEIQLTNLSPYDSLNNLKNATIYDIISSGFSSSLIAFGSINNYLHFLEQAVVSNNDTRIVAHLGAISNLVHRVDDYVLNDFSNEFHTLAVEIDSWYQGGASNQNQFAISNQLYLSVITQQIDDVSALLQTNNFLLSELTIITNEVGQISTNISWLVDNIRSLELPVTAEFRGDQDTYYDFLTNYYLSGTANDNPSSNWFERVEVLLAALVFSGNSTTNISDTLSDSSSLSQQVETLIDTIDFSQDSSNTISLSRNVQQSYINFFHSLRNTISSKSNTSTFVLGWGDKDTVTFNDLTSGNFRISISTTEGVFGTFTNIFRSVTTMVWVLFTLFCIYKMGFWLCSRIYSLYSIVRSLIFSLWGK